MKIRLLAMLILVPVLLTGQQKDLSPELTDYIRQRTDNGINTSIAIGVIDKAGPRYYAFGVKKEGGQAVNEHTIYEIGSISKVFTGILLADQIVHKKMNADDPIAKYLPPDVRVPAYTGDAGEITLGNLSDHTSGLPRLPSNMNPADQLNPYADYTTDMLYEFLSSYELPRAVGAEYEYSNLAVGLLGHILAMHADLSYEELLKEKITDPLQMHETAITLTAEMHRNLAVPYAVGMEVKNWDLSVLKGAGAIRSSVADMLKFLAANLNLEKSKLHRAMELSHQPRHDKAGGASIGLGWIIEQGSDDPIILHSGGTGGYRAYAAFKEKAKKGVVVLTNSDEDVSAIGRYLLDSETVLPEIKPSITIKFREVIESKGVDDLLECYMQEKREGGQYRIDEGEINNLGYYYLNANKVNEALRLFEINIDAFPDAFNVYDSYGEALMKSEQNDKAIINYKKSLELNPGNTNALEVLERLGVEVESEEVEVAVTILDTYVGTYQLAPGFNIEITREGRQLKGQATGQPMFDLYPKSETEFYLKVTEAQVVFSADEEGKIMLTLFQNGQVVPGKRI